MINDEYTPDLEKDENKNQEGQEQDKSNDKSQDKDPNQSDAGASNEDDADKDWKAEALKYKAILDRNKDKNKPDTKEPSKKSDDFGYDVKAYLKTSGIDSKEFDFVKTEMKQSGLKDIDSLLDNDYFKARLEKFRADKKTVEATPSGNRSGGVPTDSVEYWATKPIEDVPADMRIKVVNYKLHKEQTKGAFYNS